MPNLSIFVLVYAYSHSLVLAEVKQSTTGTRVNEANIFMTRVEVVWTNYVWSIKDTTRASQ